MRATNGDPEISLWVAVEDRGCGVGRLYEEAGFAPVAGREVEGVMVWQDGPWPD